ncbi:MAG: 5-formyltetrahydrofolate cyclo-ligase [Candidatus Omnitrophica bacterium]|nr:5-formyltetrahydrofolate cyclo-ligase [Candidatus Omnitrophota bacterium]
MICYPDFFRMTKEGIRLKLLEKLRQQPPKARLKKSAAIARKLRRLPLYRKAKVLLCYAAVDGEVETRPILDQAIADGKRVAVPITFRRDKKLAAAEIKDPKKGLNFKGPFGIPEPSRHLHWRIAPDKLDLVLVPGVAFDRRGHRLGRGLGYFDRFLEKVPADVPRIGLAFRFQVVRELPFEPHDQPMHRVITE